MCKGRVSQYLNVDNGKPYQSSAVYASAIHSITLPFRMRKMGPTGESSNESGAMDLYECIQMLAGQGRQNTVAVLDAAMPPPSMTGMCRCVYVYDICINPYIFHFLPNVLLILIWWVFESR